MKQTFERVLPSGVPAETAVEVLQDPEMVASWIPMITSLTEVEPMRQYQAVFTDSVGPFRLRADLDIEVKIGADSIEVSANGRDRQIGSRLMFGGMLSANDTDNDADGCMVHLKGWYEITGKAAQMGAGTIKRKADRIVAGFADSMMDKLGT